MAANSWYKSFTELSKSEREGISYTRTTKNRRSGIVIIAPHGGGIEPGTTEIAQAIAGFTFSYYTFAGLKSTGNELLHITSTWFDEPECLQLVQSAHTVLSIHGCEGSTPAVYTGGLGELLIVAITAALVDAGFATYPAEREITARHPRNICNRALSGKGVQLEITEGLRRSMFRGLTRPERKITTPTFRRFVGVIRKALISFTKEQGLERGRLFPLF